MKEEIILHNGKGIIHLKGSPSETVLYIKKQPRMACFHAEIGTVWRYQVGKEINEDLLGDNYRYENIVKSGKIDESLSLAKQFDHITQLLTNGTYELQLCELSWEVEMLPAIAATDENPYYDAYGGMADLTATQNYLNKDVVEEYKESISNGIRPIMVLIKIKNSWVIYVLDGHHKFQAYRALKINPKVLVMAKLDNKAIQLEEGIRIMKTLGMEREDWINIYQEEKETKAQEQNFYNYYSKGLKSYFK